MDMKRIMFAWFLIVSILLLSACSSSNPSQGDDEGIAVNTFTPNPESTNTPLQTMVVNIDYKHYVSLEELEKDAYYIIHGRVLSQRSEWRSLRIPSGMPTPANPAEDLDMVTISDVLVIHSYTDCAKENDIIKVLQFGGRVDPVIVLSPNEPELLKSEEYLFYLSKSALEENGGWLLSDVGSLYRVTGNEITPVRGGFEITFDYLENMMKK